MARFSIAVEHGIVRVDYGDEIGFDRTQDMLQQAGAEAAAHGTKLLLVDVRRAGQGPYQVDAIQHAERLPSHGIDRLFRIAFLARPGDDRLKFVEDVLVNRGFDARVFLQEGEALAWLRGGPSSP